MLPVTTRNAEDRPNNFDILRLIAAGFVFISHAFAIYGRHEPQLLSSARGSHEITLGTLGVSIFFVISGFLITQSWTRTPRLTHFLVKRVLRLYPALFLNMAVVICIIAPLTTSIFPLSQYFTLISADIFLIPLQIIFFIDIHLRGVFVHTFFPNSVNGSLWTLGYEVQCYFVIILCGFVFDIKQTLLPLTLIYVMYFWHDIFFPQNVTDLAFIHCTSFLVGSCFFLYNEYLRLNSRVAALCIASLIVLVSNDIYFLPIYIVSTAYITLYVALHLKHLGVFTKYGDFSYGLYIYAWPIQQTIAVFCDFNANLFPIFMIISFLITFILAVLSWYGVERPALSLRPLPGLSAQ